jgi:hypothetical protein
MVEVQYLRGQFPHAQLRLVRGALGREFGVGLAKLRRRRMCGADESQRIGRGIMEWRKTLFSKHKLLENHFKKLADNLTHVSIFDFCECGYSI